MEKLDSEIWEKNIKLLADRWPDLAAPLLQENAFFSPGVRLIDCRCGAKSCQVEGESGSWITLHSTYNPWREAEEIAKHIELKNDQILVLVGIGLGYLPLVLTKTIPQEQAMIIVERNTQLLKAALRCLDLSDFLSLPNLSLLVGEEPAQMVKQTGKIQLKYCLRDLNVVEHPPTVRAFPSFYRPVLKQLRRCSRSELRRRIFYPKVRSEKLNILVFDSGYFTLRESVRALEMLNHSVEVLSVPRPQQGQEQVDGQEDGGARECGENFVKRLLTKITSFKPHFIFTVNHLGFDKEGKLTELLTQLQIPVLCWYVDSPSYILENHERNLSPLLYIFVWEKHYVEKLKNLGFRNVYYLPLATDPEVFRRIPSHHRCLDSYRCDVSFVGNSMVKAVEKWFRKFPHSPAAEKIGQLAIQMQRRSHQTPMEEILSRIKSEYGLSIPFEHDEAIIAFESALVLKSTQEYRRELVEALEEFGLHIYGDEGWFSLVSPEKFALFPPLDYYTQLPLLYNASKVNLNATSFQMNSAVNQRVFDVAACGGFLLTDCQPDMQELFELGREAICYQDREQLKELVKFYLQHPQQRAEIARQARERVLAEHTYLHRMEKMISVFKEEMS